MAPQRMVLSRRKFLSRNLPRHRKPSFRTSTVAPLPSPSHKTSPLSSRRELTPSFPHFYDPDETRVPTEPDPSLDKTGRPGPVTLRWRDYTCTSRTGPGVCGQTEEGFVDGQDGRRSLSRDEGRLFLDGSVSSFAHRRRRVEVEHARPQRKHL